MSTYQIIKGYLKNEIILYHFWETCCLKNEYMSTDFEKSCVSKMRT